MHGVTMKFIEARQYLFFVAIIWVVPAEIARGNVVEIVYKKNKGEVFLNIIRITAIWEV